MKKTAILAIALASLACAAQADTVIVGTGPTLAMQLSMGPTFGAYTNKQDRTSFFLGYTFNAEGTWSVTVGGASGYTRSETRTITASGVAGCGPLATWHGPAVPYTPVTCSRTVTEDKKVALTPYLAPSAAYHFNKNWSVRGTVILPYRQDVEARVTLEYRL